MPLAPPEVRRYTVTFNGLGDWKYKLILCPGDYVDLGTADRSLPETILEGVTIKAGYDTHAIGLPLTSTMELSINLEKIQNQYLGTDLDFDELNRIIHEGGKGTNRDIDFGWVTKSVLIPNAWILMSNNGDGTTAYNTYEFIGMQEVKPEQEFELDGSNCTFKITCLDIVRSIFERISPSDIQSHLSYNDMYIRVTRLWDYLYYGGYYAGLRVEPNPGYFYLVTPAQIMGAIGSTADAYLKAFLRETTHDFGITNDWTYPITYYDTDHTSMYQTISGVGVITKFYQAWSAYGSTFESGLLWKGTQQEENLLNYDNIWDMLKFISEGHLCKCWVDINSTNGGDHEIDFKFLKLFDNTQASALTLVANDFIGNAKLRRAGEYIIKSISHINGADKENGEIEYNIEGTQAEKTFEADLVIHNHAVGYELTGPQDLTRLDKFRTLPNSRALYTGAVVNQLSEYVKVNDNCVIKTDATTSYSGDGTYDDTLLEFNSFNATSPENYIIWLNNRTSLASQGYVVAKAAVSTYGNPNQAILEFTTYLENALPRMIGDNYSIDLTGLFPTGYTPTIPYSLPADYTDGNCQLIEVEADIIKHQSKVKMFVRAD